VQLKTKNEILGFLRVGERVRGKKFSFDLKTNAGNQVKADLALIVQDQLRSIGIKVQLQSIEWTNFMNKLRKKDFDAYVGGWNT